MLETIPNSPSLMLLSASAVSLILLLPATIIASRFRSRIEGRLVGNTGATTTVSEKPRHGWLAELGQTGDGAPSEEETRLRSMMMRAGYFSRNAPYIFFGIRAISLIVPQFALFISAPMLPFQLTGLTLLGASIFAAAFGYMFPTMLLNRQIEQREQQYRDGFPAKLVLPLIMFVFPTLLVVLMMPAVVRMIWVFGGGGI